MSVEDTEQKIKFPHEAIQKQAILQLYTKLVGYSKKNGKITSVNSVDCPAIGFLLANVGHTNLFIGRQCCEQLLRAVVEGLICHNMVLKSCVTTSALKSPIKNICWLILNIVYLKEDCSLQTYSMHPLSQVLLNNTELSKQLFMSVQSFLIPALQQDFPTNTNLFRAVSSIEPFFKFVLYETSFGVELIEMIFQLTLFQHSSENLPFFKNIMLLCKKKKMVVNSSEVFLSISILLATWYLNHINFTDKVLINDLIWMLTTGIWENYKGLPSYQMLQALYLLRQLLAISLLDKETKCLQSKDELLLFCALILTKTNEDEVFKEILLLVFILAPECLNDLSVKESKSLFSLLVFPMLKLLSDQSSCSKSSEIHILTLKIFENIENVLRCNSEIDNLPLRSLNTSSQYSEIFNLCHSTLSMLSVLHSNPAVVSSWLSDLNFMVTRRNSLPKETVILILSSVLITYTSGELFREVLQTIIVVCQQDISTVMNFFPVLLYCLRSDRFKEVKLDILLVIPNLVLHKMLVGIALKLIKSLLISNELFPLAVKLGIEIWKKQPRVFPHVLELLSAKFEKSSTPSKVWYECSLAKISAVYEISNLSSTHGKDMVVILSPLLDILTASREVEVQFSEYYNSCLSLLIECLKLLCLKEVIAIESIWKIVCMKVQSNKFGPVLCSICSLLACVPTVNSKSMVLHDEVITYLWFLIQSSKLEAVKSAAYISLAEFSLQEMKVKYLPEKIREMVCERLKSLRNQDIDEEYFPLEEVCPGFAFTLLLYETEKQILPGFNVFLSSMLQQEVANLPRGIGKKGHLSITRSITSPVVKLLSEKYEQSKRPGLLPGIAAGLLCCYEPYIHGMEVENPSKVHLEIRAERYKQMLENLLQDFTIQQNDWDHSILAPQSWSHFMKKMYQVCIEGRRASLEISKEKGLVSGEEDFQDDLKSVSFWVRDQITNQLKKASKQSPRSQGNSVMALVGLANAVSYYEENICKSEVKADQYLTMRTWLLKVADTVMVVFDGNFKAKSIPFQWCQQISSGKSTASSLVARCFAALSMGQIASYLLPIDSERVQSLVNMLLERCPYQSKAGSSNQLQFYCSISLGILISSLYQQQQFIEMITNNSYAHVLSSVNALENIVFNDELDKKEGACVGYSLAVASAVVHGFNKDSKYQAVQIRHRIMKKCESLPFGDLVTIVGQELYFGLAYLTMAMFVVDFLTVDEVIDCIKLMQEKAEHSSSVGLHSALGILNHTILRSKTNGKLANDMLEKWHNVLLKQETNLLQKLGAVKGIFASYGIHSTFLKLEYDLDHFSQSINSSLKILCNLFEKSLEDSICLLVAEQFGQICLLEEGKSVSLVSVPQNYSYLKETSLLMNVFDLLMKASLNSNFSEFDECKVISLLQALVALKGLPLPPVNWASILSPLVRVGYSDSVKQLCIQFAVFYVGSSSSLALWISNFINSTLFIKLDTTTQKNILMSTESLLPYLTTSKQRVLLEEIPFCLFLCEDKSPIVSCILEQWLTVINMSTPLQSTIAYVLSAFKKFLDKITDFQATLSNHDIKLLAKLLHTLLGETWRNIFPQLPNELRYKIYIEVLTQLSPSYDDILGIIYGDDIAMKDIFELLRMIFMLNDEKLLEYLVKRLLSHKQEDKFLTFCPFSMAWTECKKELEVLRILRKELEILRIFYGVFSRAFLKSVFMSIVCNACSAIQSAGSFVFPIEQLITNGPYMTHFIKYITSTSW